MSSTTSNNNNNNNINGQQPMAVIKRPQHNSKLANVLNNMLQHNSLVDVTIYCDDGQVNAHKLVLAASSPYFRNLFNRMTNHFPFYYPNIVLREMPVTDLRTIIQFIYHGEVNVPQNRVDSLMRCANYLQIEGMASSANLLTSMLASSSSMPHHHAAILTAHSNVPSNSLSATTLTTHHPSTIHHNNTSSTLNNKIHPQYHQPSLSGSGCKSRGHSSRSNNNNNNNNTSETNSNTTSSSSNNNNKPKHVCPVCLKTFTHGFTLKRHMKLHSQSRLSIYCDVCSKSYSCKDSYLRHKKSSGHMQHAEFHHGGRSIDMNLESDR